MDAARPVSDLDLFADESQLDPYPLYRVLRDLGPAVWMPATNAFALARFADVRDALSNTKVFSSARGVALNEPINQMIAGNTLGSDGAEHQRLRGVLVRPLSPPATRALAADIESEAEALVERPVTRKRFDAATDLARHLPVSIISRLVGLPDDGREQMLDWAAAAFDTLGPENARCLSSMAVARGLAAYAATLSPANVKPVGWAAMAFEAAGRGEISHEQAVGLMLDYTAPSLDTTILAITNAIWLFGRHPEQWDLVREQANLIPHAINEVLRIESPIQVFSRYVARDHEIDGVLMPEGSRAMVLFGSANRDERKWDDPERFDIRRQATDHLAFGHGEHMCVGNPLARLEIKALLTALARRVKRFEIVEARRGLNNTLRGLEGLEIVVH